jgi:ankyrin repeat protein
MAAQMGQREIVEILVRGGADINSKSTAGETASDLALANQHREIAVFLNQYQREIKEFSRNSSVRY